MGKIVAMYEEKHKAYSTFGNVRLLSLHRTTLNSTSKYTDTPSCKTGKFRSSPISVSIMHHPVSICWRVRRHGLVASATNAASVMAPHRATSRVRRKWQWVARATTLPSVMSQPVTSKVCRWRVPRERQKSITDTSVTRFIPPRRTHRRPCGRGERVCNQPSPS